MSTIWVSLIKPRNTSEVLFADAWLTVCTDLNADSYDFNNHAYQRFVEKLKVGVLTHLALLLY